MSLKLWIDYAVDELNDLLRDATLDNAENLEDRIWELADSNTPIYYSDMLDCVSDDINLFITRPDLADEDSTPDKMIKLNIFERIESALRERLEEWKEEQEEIERERNLQDGWQSWGYSLESDPEE